MVILNCRWHCTVHQPAQQRDSLTDYVVGVCLVSRIIGSLACYGRIVDQSREEQDAERPSPMLVTVACMRAEAELRIVHMNRLDAAKPMLSNWRITPS